MKYIHLPLCMFFILILCNISLVSNAQSKFSPKPAVGQEIIYDFTNVWSCISRLIVRKLRTVLLNVV